MYEIDRNLQAAGFFWEFLTKNRTQFPVAQHLLVLQIYYSIIIIINYLLAPWGRVLLEKLTGSAARQEIPHIFGTRRFITVLTSARHLSLS